MPTAISWSPSPECLRKAQLTRFLEHHQLADYSALVQRADSDPIWFWDAVFRWFDIRFDTPYEKVVTYPNGPEQPVWCQGGTTNIVANCIDRHRLTQAWSKPAIVGVAEDGVRRTLSYADLNRDIEAFAAVLLQGGIKAGDVVGLFLPMIPEAAVAFFAILKIGAVALPLFSGFGSQPIADRLSHAGATAIVTTAFARRRDKKIDLIGTVIEATKLSDASVKVFVFEADFDSDAAPTVQTEPSVVAWRCGQEPLFPVATAIVDAETPAMLMYTSGTTGAPKGTVHTHCGMLGKNALDMGLCIDMGSDDRLLWMSDMGWIAGPKMIFASALFGSTLILAEGTPTWPESDRLFQLASDERATIVGLVPTIIRQIMRTGGVSPSRDLSSLRSVISAGESWTEEAWLWLFEEVGRGRFPILNYAGGTECGGAILIGTMTRPCRPGSFGGPVPGASVDIVEPTGKAVAIGEIGDLVMRKASIGLTRGLWKSPGRYIESYWQQIPGVWVQGDLASRDEHGLWYLHGRSDDVIKIAGKRTGPSEIEAVVMQTGLAKDCAVVGVDDAITGSALMCVYVPTSSAQPVEDDGQICDAIAARVGASYRPRHMLRVDEIPRTRNDKSMRRVVKAIVLGTPIGDLSSLANPEAIESIKRAVAARNDHSNTHS